MWLYATAMRGSSSCINEAIHSKRGLQDSWVCRAAPHLGRSTGLVEAAMDGDAGDVAVLSRAMDLSWGSKRGPITSGHSPEPPLPPKACSNVIGTVGKDRSWQDRHTHVPTRLSAWTSIYFKQATKFAHLMPGSSCYVVFTTILPHCNSKTAKQIRNPKSHCSVQQQRWSLPPIGNPNMTELIINRIKIN